MAGRPPWSQPGTEGGGQTVATNDRPLVTKINEDESSTLASGSSETIEVYPPSGSTYGLVAVRLRAPAPSGAASGNHTMGVYSMNGMSLVRARSTYPNDLYWNASNWNDANDFQRPSDPAAAVAAIQSVVATDSSPMQVIYDNDTDVDQSNSRDYRFVVEERRF